MYLDLNKPYRSGLKWWRSLRTSSALEGYHKYLRILVEAAWAAGAPWLDIITNLFDFRWIVDRGRAVALYDEFVYHYDMQLRDALLDALEALPFKEPRALPKHRPLRAGEVPLRHGSYYAEQALAQRGIPGVDLLEPPTKAEHVVAMEEAAGDDEDSLPEYPGAAVEAAADVDVGSKAGRWGRGLLGLQEGMGKDHEKLDEIPRRSFLSNFLYSQYFACDEG